MSVVNLSKYSFETEISNRQWKNITEIIEKEFTLFYNEEKDKKEPKQANLEDFQILEKILCEIVACQKSNDNKISEEQADLLRECFKAFRNSVASGTKSQNEIAFDTSVLSVCSEIMTPLMHTKNEMENKCVSMFLQFLGNLIVANKRTQRIVWEKFSQLILECITLCGNYSQYCSMILYNIFRINLDLIPDLFRDVSFFKNLIKLYDRNFEFFIILLQFLMSREYILKYYDTLTIDERRIILNIIDEMSYFEEENENEIHVDIIKHLAQDFKVKSDNVLKTVADYIDNIDPSEVKLLLEILARVSAHEKYMVMLQSDRSLLINCIFLLKSIHMLSKQKDNIFTPITQLSELVLTEKNAAVAKTCPVLGFKASLIQIIGNLCYQHRENQDQVRELDCIPLLLDCCNMDAKNPFIIQWVILAVHNLCEDNISNQKIIAEMNKVGTVDSALMDDMGIRLSEDGLRMAPLDRKKLRRDLSD